MNLSDAIGNITLVDFTNRSIDLSKSEALWKKHEHNSVAKIKK